MEPTPFLRPTALQQVRGFLAESGARELFKNKTPEAAAKALEKAFDASTPAAPAPIPADVPKYKGVCV